MCQKYSHKKGLGDSGGKSACFTYLPKPSGLWCMSLIIFWRLFGLSWRFRWNFLCLPRLYVVLELMFRFLPARASREENRSWRFRYSSRLTRADDEFICLGGNVMNVVRFWRYSNFMWNELFKVLDSWSQTLALSGPAYILCPLEISVKDIVCG
jgi:hypothetical protein